ncbi:hypothetical protein EVAR_98724_1 [Eumeta japonica]|uniref:Uncharacterized protein n=1 Tax=Eumeta variegata TaxID=151549 RepID=A0A4C1ZH72_EUMVA|nr:hypothetical protein EVAR_98724_1 [Eumeta japonica]
MLLYPFLYLVSRIIDDNRELLPLKIRGALKEDQDPSPDKISILVLRHLTLQLTTQISHHLDVVRGLITAVRLRCSDGLRRYRDENRAVSPRAHLITDSLLADQQTSKTVTH